MIIEDGFDQIVRNEHSVLTVGSFDGIHIGHQAIITYLNERAAIHAGQSVVVSFDRHPRTIVKESTVPLLTTLEEKSRQLEAAGVDRFVILPFTREFASLSATAFVEEILVSRIGLKAIVIGYDHGFGKGREGNRDLLETLGQQHHFSVDVVPAELVQEDVVSSTALRALLADEGAVSKAMDFLGRPYSLKARVIKGEGRGRKIGFPTANLDLLVPEKLIPLNGVYAVLVRIEGDSRPLQAMMNIGVRPTFGGTEQSMEVHLFEYDQDLYGRQLEVAFIARTRSEMAFPSVDALVQQLYRDQERCMAEIVAYSTSERQKT